jgi:hypothetical protein
MSAAKRKLEQIEARRQALITKAEAGDECAASDLWKEFGDIVDPNGELDPDEYSYRRWVTEREMNK